jgi:hypothetical protein
MIDSILVTMVKAMLIVISGGLWLSASGLSRRMDMFERVVCSVSLGVVFAVFVGCVSFLIGFAYVDLIVVCLMLILFGLFMVRAGFVVPRIKLERVEKKYWLPISLFCVHIAFFAFYLRAFPFFPPSDAMDIVWHIQMTTAALGSVILPWEPLTEKGAHVLFAFSYSFLGGDVLTSLRVTTAFVESLSVLVAYCLFQRIFKRCMPNVGAAYATTAFALVLPSGLLYYADTGTYANIIGDFFVLLTLLLILIVSEGISFPSALTLFVVETLALIAHISVMIFAALMVSCSIVVFKYFRFKFRNYVFANLGFVALPVVMLVIAPQFVFREISFIFSHSYVAFQSKPTINLVTWFNGYLSYAGPINLGLVFIGLGMAVTRMRQHFESFLLGAWSIFLFLAIFFGSVGTTWRFVLLSFVPACGLFAVLLARIQHHIGSLVEGRVQMTRLRNAFVSVSIIGILLISIASGSLPRLVIETYLAEGIAPQGQLSVYDSMAWLKSNSNSETIVVSVGLQREYRYLPILFNRTYVGDYELLLLTYPGNPYHPSSLMALEGVLHFNYVVVSANYVGLQNYYACADMRLVFQNSQVVIFKVIGNSCTGNGAVGNLAVSVRELV